MSAMLDLFEEPAAELPQVVPLTKAEWTRVLGKRPFRILVDEVKQAWAGRRAVRCMGCKYASDSAHEEPWRAWCLVHQVQVSNTFPKLCREHQS